MKLETILEKVEEQRYLEMKPMQIKDIIRISVVNMKIEFEIGVLGQTDTYRFSKSALHQYLNLIGVAGAYKSLNTHFKNYEELTYFLDTMLDFGKTARGEKHIQLIINPMTRECIGIVGPRYVQTLNHNITEPAIKKFGEAIDTHTSFITDDIMEINFAPSVTKKSKIVGEVVGFGAGIFNSPNGHRSLGVREFAMIIRCSNGQALPENIFSNKMIHNNRNIQHRFNMLLNHTFTDKMGDTFLDYIDKVANRPALVETPEEIPNITRKFDIVKKHEEGIIKSASKYNGAIDQINSWRIFNAVNYYATHYPNDEKTAMDLLMNGFEILQFQSPVKYKSALIGNLELPVDNIEPVIYEKKEPTIDIKDVLPPSNEYGEYYEDESEKKQMKDDFDDFNFGEW